MKTNIQPDFEKFFDESPLPKLRNYQPDHEQIKQLMWGAYMAGYSLAMEETTKALKSLKATTPY